MQKMIPISIPGSSEPKGHYSYAMEAGGLVFLSGRLAIGEDGVPAVGSSIETQMTMCLEGIQQTLAAAGLDVSDVVKTTVYLSDIAHWPTADGIYAKFFGSHRPARAIVPVNKLHFGLDVEIEAIALQRG